MKIRPGKANGKACWVLDFGLVDGKRRRKFFDSRGQAEKALRDAKSSAVTVGDALASIRPSEQVEAAKILIEMRSAGVSLSRVWADWQQKCRGSARTAVPLHRAISDMIAAKHEARRRHRYVVEMERYLRRFALGRENDPVSSIAGADIERWFGSRGESPATRASNMGRLSALFDFACRRDWIDVNPCRKVERVTVEQRVPGILAVDQVEKLMREVEKCDPGLGPWFGLALFGGIRPGEIQRLTWEDIDKADGIVRIDASASKVRQRRIVHLEAAAAAWVRSGPPETMPPSNLRRRLWQIRAASGIGRWAHDVLRHTAASMLLAKCQDVGRVAIELGTSPGMLFRHYREIVTLADAARFWAIVPKATAKA